MATLLIKDEVLLKKIKDHGLEAYKRKTGEATTNSDEWMIWRNGLPCRMVNATSKEAAFRKYLEKIRA